MSVLVTGATGFVGAHLVRALSSGPHSVRALVRPGTDAAGLEAAGVEVVRGDLRDPQASRRAARGCRVIYHAAAITSHGSAPARATYETNVDGTGHLAEAALDAGVERLVFCSAVKVYGVSREGAIGEDSPRAPVSPYARSKARAEDLLLDLAARRGLPVVVARLGGMFGPGAVGWLGLFRSIAEGSFRMLGRGDGLYQAGDVEDVVAGLVRCGEVPGIEGRVYHLTGAEPVRLAEIVAMIAGEVGGPPLPRPLPAAPLRAYQGLQRLAMRLSGRSLPRFSRVEFFLGDRVFDISRARRELNYSPQIDLRTSIARTATWFRDRGLLPAPDRGPGYIHRL
ncbi:MAG: NAD-dependent epimerase/dehydratase family protein [Gemmatimonadota bacterium]